MPSTKRKTHMCPVGACDCYGYAGESCWNPEHGALIPIPKRKAMVQREDDVELKYRKACELNGELFLKVAVLGRPGYPDRLVIGNIERVAFNLRRIVRDYMHAQNTLDEETSLRFAEELVASALRFAEVKKTKRSRFQPKQKTVIPMLRKRGVRVDILHG